MVHGKKLELEDQRLMMAGIWSWIALLVGQLVQDPSFTLHEAVAALEVILQGPTYARIGLEGLIRYYM